MKDAHLRAEDIDPLLWDEDEIRNRLILHHLAVCPECYEVAGYILDLYMAGEVTISLGSIDIALGRSRRDAPALWEQLARHSFDRQKALIKDTTRFRSWGLCELLCMKAEYEASHDPGKARELAELAVEISSLIDEDEVAEPHWQHELRGYALAHLANTQRVMSDLGAAEATFALADQWWGPADANMGNVLGYEARYLALKASLRRDQRQMQEALDLLEQALAANPVPELHIRILINKAKTLEEIGEIGEAIEVLGKACVQAPDDSDARIRLCLAQNHLDYLSKAERYVEAQATLPDVQPLVEELGSESDNLRFRWTRARIAKGLGRTDEAVLELEAIRQEFARLGLRYDAALASLELGLMYAHLGRTHDVLEVVQNALTILSDLRVEREALMAIRVLTQAVQDGQVTVELIDQVLHCLRRDREPSGR